MRRLAAIVLAALVAAACGGASADERGAPPPPTASEPTAAQLEFREQLLEQIASGEYGDCDCTGDERAADRVASGKTDPP